MKRNAQIARRFVWVHLPHPVPRDWGDRMLSTGMQKAEWLRMAPDPTYVDAADIILSDVIDRYFIDPTPWSKIARDLGFPTLDASAEAKEQTEKLQRFFELVSSSTGVREDGYLVIFPHADGPVEKAWYDLADPPDLLDSQRCTEVDWSQVLQAPWDVNCDIKPRRNRVLVRFVGVHDASLLRYRDTQRGGSENGGGSEVHPGHLDGASVLGDFGASLDG